MNNGLVISTLRAMNEDVVNHVGYAADVIEALQQQLHEEHEAHLMAEQKWIEQLAAAQDREKVLRDALDFLANNLGEYAGAMQTQQQADILTNYAEAAFAALTLPTDDTALKALLKAERERCAKACSDLRRSNYSGETGDWIDGTEDCSIAIRALGDA